MSLCLARKARSRQGEPGEAAEKEMTPISARIVARNGDTPRAEIGLIPFSEHIHPGEPGCVRMLSNRGSGVESSWDTAQLFSRAVAAARPAI